MEFSIPRLLTGPTPPEDRITWRWVPVGGRDVEVPAFWSDTAAEIVATRYLRPSLGESSVRQLFTRVVDSVVNHGVWQKRLTSEQRRVLRDEWMHVLLHQMASFNSPVYFNAGIFEMHGVAGTAESFAWDEATQRVQSLSTAYVRPQVSACFIQSVRDDLLSILDLLRSEAKLFKYGSGTGTNFSALRARGEKLEGGGTSTGVISFLEIFDKAAQAIKSGGTNRRAAKMVILDADHPQALEFVHWKRDEERKARVLLAAGYGGGMEGEAFRTVSGQNSNNSIRVTDAFMRQAETGRGEAASLLREMAKAAWECADPGVLFQDTIQKWNVCAADGPIRASNPCSEYMFLDDSACNLASLNLARFLKDGEFQWTEFRHVARLMLLAQEIWVDAASYPTAKIAENSHLYRPLGLGYSNLGGLLMRMGIPYDSETAAEWTTRITGAMHLWALEASVEMAEAFGPFARWKQNAETAKRVLEAHHQEWRSRRPSDMEALDEQWEEMRARAARVGLRHAQVTLIAPTGTIGLLMDCETLGIEPDFALIKHKTLAEGGELRLVNGAVRAALEVLQYSETEIEEILAHVQARGAMVGAPILRAEHLPIFDCAMAPAGHPARRVTQAGHLRILAAAQPFLSGAISKTVNLPTTTSSEQIEQLMVHAWKLGLKSLAIYRDGSKALQPLCAEC